MLGAKVTALLDGRYNVAYEDVRQVVPSALRHRLLLNFEGLADEISPDLILDELLEQVPELEKSLP